MKRKLTFKRKVERALRNGIRKVGTFIEILWRDRMIIVIKFVQLATFAIAIKTGELPGGVEEVQNLYATSTGIMCLIPAEWIVNSLDFDYIEKQESRKEKRRRKKEEGGDDNNDV